MASVNKWIGIGNVGRDPETRFFGDGSAVANVSIACGEQWKDKDTGEKKESTEWVRLVFHRKLAEIVGEYVKKGSQIYVEGRLKTREWTDKDGTKRYTTEVVCDVMKMLGGRGERSEDGPKQSKPTEQPRGKPAGSIADMDSDVPFSPIDRRALYII